MTTLVRTLTDPGDIAAARFAAHEEFLHEMRAHPEMGEKVSEALLARWFRSPGPAVSLTTKILNEFGPAVSTRLERPRR